MLLTLLFALAAQDSAVDASPGSPGSKGAFELMDVFDLELAVDPRISPDGEQVLFLRTSMDVMKDRTRSRLWIVDFDGGEPRPVTSGEASESSPRWSPDGERVAYVSSAAGSTQLYVRWMDTGASTRLTQLERSPSSLSWSPDGRWLAFTMFVPSKPEPMATLPAAPKGAEWAEPAKVIEEVHYRSDGAGYTEPGRSQVYVLSALGGTPRRLTDDEFDYGGPLAWTPDSRSLIVSANRGENVELNPVESELWELALEDGALTRLTTRVGPDASPTVSPDGTRIAYTGFDDRRQGYQVTELYVMQRSNGTSRSLTEALDRSVESPRWAADGSGLFFAYDDRGDTNLAFVNLEGEIQIVAEHLGGLSFGRPYGAAQFTVGKDGRFAFTLASLDRPAEIATGSLAMRGEGQPRRVTDLGSDLLSFRTPGEVEMIWCDSSFDDRPIQAWIVKPPHFDPAKTYPMVLEIHGGPFANYGRRFSIECQLYAAAGYVVVYVNPRGSTSYGEEFGNLIHHIYPSEDYDDLMSAVDEDQLFVTGGSGGGVLTAWIVGKTNRFRAAVVAKPVINWMSFSLTADAYPFFTQYWFADMPWENPDAYWKRSPLSLVGNVETPTMLLTGEEDYRTPISESEQYYQALKLREIDTALVRIPGASHGIAARPSHLMSKVAHVLAWFERYRASDQAGE